ncbi:MAG: LXG domain-containing protein [Proteobacteria bacterium]|nr:LXG domain-containing protein [Pseudomonadota bacterium]
MSLLDDLKSLDISAILSARESISLSINSDDIQNVLERGAADAALSALGELLNQLREEFDSPEKLLLPLVDAVGSIGDVIDTDYLPIAQYLEAIQSGAQIIATLIEGLGDDPTKLGKVLGLSLGDILDTASSVMNVQSFVHPDLPRFKQIIEIVDTGRPTDPRQIAELALEILNPFPIDSLSVIRSGVSGILDGIADISLPSGRTDGLIIALNDVTVSASAGDSTQLTAALAQLETVRAQTITSLNNDLMQVATRIGQLPVSRIIDSVSGVSGVFNKAEVNVLEQLESWRKQMEKIRLFIENLPPEILGDILTQLIETLEEYVNTYLVEPIEKQVVKLENWIRSLLRELPLREYRNQLRDFLFSIARAIRDANLDGPVKMVKDLLNGIEEKLDPEALTADIQAALQGVEDVIGGVLDQITGFIETIGGEINALSSQAVGYLEQAAQALADFKSLIDSVTAAIDQLGIEQAADQVKDALVDLRETAETLLTIMPLPDSLRPLIEQLISSIEGIDFDVVIQPLRQAASKMEIPEEVGTTINESLQTVADLITNLIPDELITSLENEIKEALDTLRNFDLSTLLGDLDNIVEEAASFIGTLDPRPVADSIRGPYQAVLDAVDAVAPARLMAPLIEAYDSLLGSIPMPTPENAVRGVANAVNEVGQQAAQAITAPLAEMVPGASIRESSDERVPVEAPTDEPEVRAGDIVRLLGYLPNKLREILNDLEEGAIGDVLGYIDNLCGGLARDIRSLSSAMLEIDRRVYQWMEDLLQPLSRAQLSAQAAISVNISAGEIDINASMHMVALAGPASMRRKLGDSRGLVKNAVKGGAKTAAGVMGSHLEKIALSLEKTSLSRLCRDADSFLAALDPEPIAAELDALVTTVMQKTPQFLDAGEDALRDFINRFTKLVQTFNPGVLAHRFLRVTTVLKEEIDILNPRRLAAELGEIHGAIKQTIMAYDPAVLAEEIWETISALSLALQALKPSELLSELSPIGPEFFEKIENAMPTKALKDIDRSLDHIGAQLKTLDPSQLLESVNELGPRVVDEFERGIEIIRSEILALLNAIRYATGSGSAQVSVSVSTG